MSGQLSLASQLVKRSRGRIGDDRISLLPEDLLVEILLHLPTKDAVSTTVLSKRWRYVWTKLPLLVYSDGDCEKGPVKNESSLWFVRNIIARVALRDCSYKHGQESVWWFLNQSLKLHKASVLNALVIELGPGCPVNADVRELIAFAVDRRVQDLLFYLNWLSSPISLPDSLYICDTLVSLTLSNKILVDVPGSVCLPSLTTLVLLSVVYKDEDSLVRLLSGCLILKTLVVLRHDGDNLTKFSVKVPSLLKLIYTHKDNVAMRGSLVIDSAALKKIYIHDWSGNSCSIENNSRFDKASIAIKHYPEDKFKQSLSSVMSLSLLLSVETVVWCNTINFSQLRECCIRPFHLDWLEPCMMFLQNTPNLKVLQINQTHLQDDDDFPLSYRPSSVPGCLSDHLEIFEWKRYRGTNSEKEVVRYILANAKCLKRVGISIKPCENSEKIVKELESMSRVSTSSQLLFSTHGIKFY